jgi:hypothetical protein
VAVTEEAEARAKNTIRVFVEMLGFEEVRFE